MEGNLPFFLCILGQFPSTRYLEGRFNEGFSALRVWGAYTWRGLFSEFYVMRSVLSRGFLLLLLLFKNVATSRISPRRR